MSATLAEELAGGLTRLPLETGALECTVSALGVVDFGSRKAVIVRIKRLALTLLHAAGRSRWGEERVAA